MMVRYIPEMDSNTPDFQCDIDLGAAHLTRSMVANRAIFLLKGNNGIKKDYIYCPSRKRYGKNLQAGYYHLLTRVAVEQAFLNHVRNNGSSKAKVIFGSRSNEKKEKRLEYLEVKRILYNRCISDEPDDFVAARTRLLKAQSGQDMAARFGHASFLPALTSAFLIGAS